LSRVELAPDVFVPSLEQVLELTGEAAAVYVELKGKGVEGASIEVIRASRSQCAVHSFDHSAIARTARLAPEIRRGILFDDYPRDIVAEMRAADALDVWPRWTLIDRQLVDEVHGAGGRVIAWTVNAVPAAQQLVVMGVDGLCGDDVRVFTQ
jgi:glycerophosphoryl diester phosphodiesterase